jgi:hypothetical protein
MKTPVIGGSFFLNLSKGRTPIPPFFPVISVAKNNLFGSGLSGLGYGNDYPVRKKSGFL